ncbi:MAG: GTPase Era [Gammaproteobacteria bacterium]|jgi:GTP-binding protein Era
MAEGVKFRSGFAAIVGRPNVGKSTLLNRIVGQKLTITSSRPQTTRHKILGIKTSAAGQVIYVDTPGLHRAGRSAINRYMNRAAKSALVDVDAVLWVIEALRWTDEDQDILAALAGTAVPVVLVVNKVDKVEDKTALLPFLQEVAQKREYAAVIPLSAREGDNIERLETVVLGLLPEGAAFFPEDQVTDRSERFLAAEIVREKLMRRLSDELPYAVTVQIESFSKQDGVLHIHAVIWVEKEGQKAIVIGKGGAVLKEVGQRARITMEHVFGAKVFLKTWVRVKESWSEDERLLRQLGYDEEEG